ncbi:hypothetical protein ABH935_000057 [Catenulispora sp. GAS73]
MSNWNSRELSAIGDASQKYDRYGPGPVGAVTGPATYPVTLRVVPDRAAD